MVIEYQWVDDGESRKAHRLLVTVLCVMNMLVVTSAGRQ